MTAQGTDWVYNQLELLKDWKWESKSRGIEDDSYLRSCGLSNQVIGRAIFKIHSFVHSANVY